MRFISLLAGPSLYGSGIELESCAAERGVRMFLKSPHYRSGEKTVRIARISRVRKDRRREHKTERKAVRQMPLQPDF